MPFTALVKRFEVAEAMHFLFITYKDLRRNIQYIQTTAYMYKLMVTSSCILI